MTDETTTTTTIPLNPPLVVTIGDDTWLAVTLLHQHEPDVRLDDSTQRFTASVYVLVGSTGRTMLMGADGITSVRPLLPEENPF